MIKDLSTILIQFCVACLVSLAAFELYLKANPEKYHSYGWIKSNNISTEVEKCAGSGDFAKVGVFGDSFSEYYLGTDNNIANQLQERLGDSKVVCNFGLSGTDIPSYLRRFTVAVDENLEMESAVFFLHEGNDFVFVPDLENLQEAMLNRDLNPLYEALKRSRAVNFVWRQVVKKFLFKNPVDAERAFYKYKDTPFQGDIDYIEKKLAEMDPSLLDEFSYNRMNVNWLLLGLSRPDYYSYLNSRENLSIEYESIVSHINAINEMGVANSVEVRFFIIPSDYYVGMENKVWWEDVFQFEHYPFVGRTMISDKLMSDFPNIFYADNLRPSDYLYLDGHLKPKGNEKLADFVNEHL